MKKALLLLVIAAIFVAGIISPAVSAAGIADGKDVPKHGYVLLGETGLNFTANFSDGGTYKWMWWDGTGNGMFSIDPPGNVGIPDNIKPGNYYQSEDASGTILGGNYCIVADPANYPLRFVDKDKNPVSTIPAGMNQAVTLTLQGKPGAVYKVTVSDGTTLTDGTAMSRLEKTPSLQFTYHPTQSGTYKVTAKNTADTTETAELNITVGTSVQPVKVTFDGLSADVTSGRFATGDKLTLSGKIENAEFAASPINAVYLYITGYNFNANGVNLEKGSLVDGDDATFTQADYDAETKTWTYSWDTTTIPPGTYTVYASVDPVGYSASLSAGVAPGSQEITLSDKSIHVKFAEENSGRFTQGDVIYSYWSARGSPIGVRWYIVGTNFLESGISSGFPLYTADQSPGKDAPQGVYGFTYDRYFSKEMAPGNYYLIYQHPGYDNRFDVYPDSEGSFTSLQTTFGESADVSARPMENVAEVIRTLIKNSLSDDLYVISDITIESPRITIDQVENLAIGDSLKIRGTTNYAGTGTTADGTEISNTFSLKINRLDFELTEENAAMQMQTVSRVTPENQIPYYGERTYAFDAIDTSTWFEGTYEAIVTNVDTGFSKTMTFTVGGEGIEKDSETLQVSADLVPDEIPDEIEDELLYPIEPVSIPDEPAPSSPGFILAPLGLAAAFILRRK